jgi:hypothetical protein
MSAPTTGIYGFEPIFKRIAVQIAQRTDLTTNEVSNLSDRANELLVNTTHSSHCLPE